ncbi:class I SAM-dependent methyltransferase [Geomonas sp. Red32]|uniref:class I SAM-dependent methyltransferase n=1 Tax=Geomonas sp. Red32 TaxID=2912856 RepID=UPI00202CAB7A|nr:class I SAM-dependent methyltransferase [Geomonas sp. Red32]MCM0081365.1 class I SAM-dependent methyltransferase [Geomonas sp. Red32]
MKCIRKQVKNCRTLAFEYGQYRTIRRWSCLDRSGAPLPWYTYPAIEYLSSLDFTGKRVFEYGCGNSTLWWESMAAEVYAVEDSPEWYRKISALKSARGAFYLETEQAHYVGKIRETGQRFDVVVIDGKHRLDCSLIAGDQLAENGMIVLDNADWNLEAARNLRERFDLVQVDFHGFGPINDYTWTTSLFLSRRFDFGSRGQRPARSIGGING